ncbi:MAG TPA: oligosaccharide flippase family protein, partial [Solirubrobacteraceae bacterium]|nr:oligosaccharide flippase family protein [Solirubrobacteraceae bacterium]
AVGPAGLISVIITTRLLGASKYGELGVLFVFAGFATTLYNTGSLHGTFMWVYGASEGEGDDVGADGKIASNHRRALGTGVVLTLAIVAAGTALCFALAPQLAQLLHIHSPERTALVRWAAVSAATGSLWRLTVNVFRMERQPGRFAASNALRPLFVVATTVPLLLLGYGVQGVLAGTALGSLVASVACIALARRSYAVAFSWSDVREIVSRGALVVVPVLCLYLVHNSDTVLVSHFTSGPAVGTYRVATRFAVLPSYFASSFLMAWAPLEQGALFQATYRHAGEERVRGAILTYYLLAGVTIVMLLDVSANGLALLAGPEYRSAAPLIPLIGLGFVCYGLYIVLVRIVKVKRIMLWYALGAMFAMAVQFGIASVTIPWLGAYGAPLATIAGVLFACLMWIAVVRLLMKGSVSFETRPLACLGVAVAIAVAVQGAGLSLWPAGRPVVLALVLTSYVTAVLALGVVPRRHFGQLLRLARATVRQRVRREDPTAELGRLPAEQRALLASLERDRVPIAVLADRAGRAEQEIGREYVASLRDLIGAGPVSSELAELDMRVGEYLLSSQLEAQRDRLARKLLDDGLDPLELVELDETARRLRALPRDSWTTWTAQGRVAPDHNVSLKDLTRRLFTLPESHRQAALMVLRDGCSAADAAERSGLSEPLAAARVVRLLRAAGHLGRGGPEDARIGIALFDPRGGPLPSDARAVALVYRQVRRFSPRQWRQATSSRSSESPSSAGATGSLTSDVREHAHRDHAHPGLANASFGRVL